MKKESLDALKNICPLIDKKRNRRKTKLKFFHPIEKDNEFWCPDDNIKMEFQKHFIGMMNMYQVGNEGNIYICPKCKEIYLNITIFRD
jgi:hypothetical protein